MLITWDSTFYHSLFPLPLLIQTPLSLTSTLLHACRIAHAPTVPPPPHCIRDVMSWNILMIGFEI